MSDSMLHPDSEQIDAYLDGTLDDADRAVFDSHLLTCARCQAEVEEGRALFGLLAELPGLEPSADFADRVMARVQLRQPLPARVAAMARRLLPGAGTTWTLLTLAVAFPVVALGAAAAWMISQPWFTVQGFAAFALNRTSAAAAWVGAHAMHVVAQSGPVHWLTATAQTLLASAGLRGIGAAAAIFATLLVVSAWILYQNLFRTPTRDTDYASYSF